MTSYRTPQAQAEKLVSKKTRIGKSRHGLLKKDRKFIAGIATAHKHLGNARRIIEWLKKRKLCLKALNAGHAETFLREKACSCVLKTVESYHQTFWMIFDVTAKKIDALDSVLMPRAYLPEQIQLLQDHATPDLSLSIQIMRCAGLRAVELDTIAHPDDVKEDARPWLAERFDGHHGAANYVVTGKGGLCRTVRLTAELAIELEARRLSVPVKKRQRGIYYTKRYTILGGHNFSQQFSRLSLRRLTWSAGGHGLRHRYALDRLLSLQLLGYTWDSSLLILSQELGHFSIRNTLLYTARLPSKKTNVR